MKNKLRYLNISVFLQTQIFMLPVLFLFYQQYGLSTGDFFLLQGVFSLSALFLEIPMGYLADIFAKRTILIFSYMLYVLRLILWLFFAKYGYWIFFIGEVLYAAQKASFTGVADSYIYEYLKFNNIPQKMNKRYGKMNFFMSCGTAFSSLIGASIYACTSQYTLSKYNYNYGFIVLIVLELILNLIAIVFLFQLPKIPQPLPPKTTLKNIYMDLFKTIVWVIKNQNIKYHILYSGLLAAATLVFVWSFQPIMKLLLLPVSLYGVVYFINHIFRALGSLYSDKISQIITLPKMAISVFVGFILCFILTFSILHATSIPVPITLLYFIFISLVIGGQLIFYLRHVCRLHMFIPSKIRATASSISTMIGRLYAGFFFILMKILLDGVSIQKSLTVCFIIFIIASYPLRKVSQKSLQINESKNLC